MEDKQEICKMFLPVLKSTVEGKDIVELVYAEKRGVILINYSNGLIKIANVENLSGLEMISAIIVSIS